MVKRNFLVRSTLATALLSALVLSQSAHAGLLGGGSASGSLGGALGGGFGPRSLDIGGAGAGSGHLSRDAVSPPRGDKALQKAGEAKTMMGGKAEAVKQAAGDKADDGSADRSAGLGLMSQGAGTLSRSDAAPSAMSDAPAKPALQPTPPATTATRKADASAGASAQASRNERSVSADGSAQASARR
ncbi:MAG: hypothetical protein ABIN37_13230 [Burkholderiaceae bacterium]